MNLLLDTHAFLWFMEGSELTKPFGDLLSVLLADSGIELPPSRSPTWPAQGPVTGLVRPCTPYRTRRSVRDSRPHRQYWVPSRSREPTQVWPAPQSALLLQSTYLPAPVHVAAHAVSVT